MSKTFKFIHAADLHLGSLLNINGIPNQQIQDSCKSAVYDAYELICDKAISCRVDFILLCGDVYDSYLRSVRGNRFFINQCLRLNENNINVYVIYGNHDAMNGEKELFDIPQNVHILSHDKVDIFEVYKEGEVIAKIIGKSYKYRHEKEETYKDYILDNDVFNIAMLHTALEKENISYIPCNVMDLMAVPNIDYWALGHIHKGRIISKAKPIIAFAGIPQGRDMGEQGLGGVFCVEVLKKEVVNIEFLPIASVVYKGIDIMIDELHDAYNFTNLISEMLKPVSDLIYNSQDMTSEFKGYIVKLTVRGRTSMHHDITLMKEEDYKQIIESLNEELTSHKYYVWIDSITFRTTPQRLDFESLKMQNSIFEDLEEIINLYSSDIECKNELLKNWGSIWKKQNFSENIDEDKFDYNDETIVDIMSQAKELLIEKLSEALEIE